jgi:secreted trypsin-like serine protease
MDQWLESVQESEALRSTPAERESGPRAILDRLGPTVGENRIVGGTAFKQVPQIGALLYRQKPHCTGTLIGSKTIVTAGHCVQGFRADLMGFGVGANAWEPESTLPVASMHAHPGYRAEPLGTHDIALVFLAENAPFAPLPLPTKSDVETALRSRQALAFIGYGYATRPDGIKYRLGYKARTDMAPREVDPFTFVYGDSERNTCNGDSGGPALLVPESGSPILIGITSWGDDACRDKGVDMRIDAYLDYLAPLLDRPEELAGFRLNSQQDLVQTGRPEAEAAAEAPPAD